MIRLTKGDVLKIVNKHSSDTDFMRSLMDICFDNIPAKYLDVKVLDYYTQHIHAEDKRYYEVLDVKRGHTEPLYFPSAAHVLKYIQIDYPKTRKQDVYNAYTGARDTCCGYSITQHKKREG